MTKSLLQPYLNFNGNCKEAMEFYQTVLGGKLELTTFGDMPMDGMPTEYKAKIMHASLENDTLSFMASDGRPDVPVVFGDSVHLSIAGTDEAQITGFFEGLSAGGTVTMPLAKQSWGDKFGMCTDKFGMHWMVNISSDKKEA